MQPDNHVVQKFDIRKICPPSNEVIFSPLFLSVSAILLLNLAQRQCYAYVIGLFTRPEIKSWLDVRFCGHAQCVLPRCCVRHIVFVFFFFYLELFPGPVALVKVRLDVRLDLDYVYRHDDNENPRESTPLHLLYRYWSEIRSRVRIWKAEQHTSLRIPGNTPSDCSVNNCSLHSVNQKSRRILPYIASSLGYGFAGKSDGTSPPRFARNMPGYQVRKLNRPGLPLRRKVSTSMAVAKTKILSSFFWIIYLIGTLDSTQEM